MKEKFLYFLRADSGQNFLPEVKSSNIFCELGSQVQELYAPLDLSSVFGLSLYTNTQVHVFVALDAKFQNPSTAPSGIIWVGVLVVLTTGKQSQLPGLAWDGSLTITKNSGLPKFAPLVARTSLGPIIC